MNLLLVRVVQVGETVAETSLEERLAPTRTAREPQGAHESQLGRPKLVGYILIEVAKTPSGRKAQTHLGPKDRGHAEARALPDWPPQKKREVQEVRAHGCLGHESWRLEAPARVRSLGLEP